MRVETRFSELPELLKIKSYNNPTKYILKGLCSLHPNRGQAPRPLNQGLQSCVPFGDMEILISEILYH